MGNRDFKNPDIYLPRRDRCPLCNSDEIRDYHHIEKYDPPFKTDRCRNCGFIFMNPRFNDAVVKNLYSENYYSGRAEYSYHDERHKKKHSEYVWKKRIDVIRSFIKSGNFLDIGSSFGGFLSSAAKYFTPYGIELSPYSGEYAKTLFGDRIHIGTLANHPFSPGTFSVITMIEVIEHCADPAADLIDCYKLLKKDGVLVIQTANMDGLQARLLKKHYAYFMPGHLSYFSRRNLLQVLAKTGFSKIKVFYPVEFGLVPKLLKSAGDFQSPADYLKWLRISAYHFAGKIHLGNFAVMSSMVIYAFK